MTTPSAGRRAGHLPVALVVLLAVLGSGCRWAPATPSAGKDASVSTATLLESLAVLPRPQADPLYRRAEFGRAWADTDRNGCSQRVDALARAVDRGRPFTEVRRGRCAHDVVAGTWVDPYTGQAMTLSNVKDQRQAQLIPVDHVVALASAARYGAREWPVERRLQFATDLLNLQPTSRRINSAKSDRDAAAWRPRNPFQCAYATRYVKVKAKYALAVDQSERWLS